MPSEGPHLGWPLSQKKQPITHQIPSLPANTLSLNFLHPQSMIHPPLLSLFNFLWPFISYLRFLSHLLILLRHFPPFLNFLLAHSFFSLLFCSSFPLKKKKRFHTRLFFNFLSQAFSRCLYEGNSPNRSFLPLYKYNL